MRLLAVLAALTTLLTLAPAANSHGSWRHCDPLVEIVVVPDDGPLYIVIDDPNGPHPGVWIYLESNGIRYLQRGGVNLLGEQDWCVEWDPSDTAIL